MTKTIAAHGDDDEETAPIAESLASTRRSSVLRAVHVHEVLVEEATQHVADGRRVDALHAIDEILQVLEPVRDRWPFARVLVVIGECLLELDDPERAEIPLGEAVALADAAPDARLAARARHALGYAWFVLGDPACRAMLEDARATYARLGDRAREVEVAKLARRAAGAAMELPRPPRASGSSAAPIRIGRPGPPKPSRTSTR
jgi:hypothetical protein